LTTTTFYIYSLSLHDALPISFLVVLSKNDIQPTLFGYKGEIEHYLNEFLKDDLKQNTKLGILGDEFDKIHVEEKKEVFDKVIDEDRKSTRLNSSHVSISYAVF